MNIVQNTPNQLFLLFLNSVKKLCMLRIMIFTILCFISLFSYSQADKISKKHVKQLVKYMCAEFSSEEQSKSDTDFYHITLRMKRILQSDENGYWLYVEQATANAQLKPYRQRVYHISKYNDTTIESQVYELNTPKLYIGGWKQPTLLQQLTKDSLQERKGCSIYLQKNGKLFTGSTPGKQCISTLRGANYATSEVTVYPDKLISWDRGWNNEDKQVWGAEKGGYIFKRLKSL